jgi:hypothetical protein
MTQPDLFTDYANSDRKRANPTRWETPLPAFDGKTIEPQDTKRLEGQYARVFKLMSDGEWRTLSEIQEACGGSEAGVSARLRDFRKPRNGSHTVNRRRRAGGLFEYELIPAEQQRIADK